MVYCTQGNPLAPTFTKAADACQADTYKGQYLVQWNSGEVTLEEYENDEAFQENFIKTHEGEVSLAEPHYRLQGKQSHFGARERIGGYPNWGVDIIGAPLLWPKVKSGIRIKVALLDSGIDLHHPELAGTIAVNEAEVINGLDDDGNGLVDDRWGYDFIRDSHEIFDHTGHGTHLAGVIAAQHHVGSVLGIAPTAEILPITFFKGRWVWLCEGRHRGYPLCGGTRGPNYQRQLGGGLFHHFKA